MPSNANNYARNNFKSYVGVSDTPLTQVRFTKKIINQPTLKIMSLLMYSETETFLEQFG